MRDIKVKSDLIYTINVESYNENNEKMIIEKTIYDFLPVDKVITIDSNGYVYLYDQCIQITDDMIEEVL